MPLSKLVELRRGDVNVDDGVVAVTRAAVRVDGGWIVGDSKSAVGIRVPMPPKVIGRERERPFAAEYALLAELCR